MREYISCEDCRYAKPPTVCEECGHETNTDLCNHETSLHLRYGGMRYGGMSQRFMRLKDSPCAGGKLFEAKENE